jgi:2-methylcitrate dehydratase PrpD
MPTSRIGAAQGATAHIAAWAVDTSIDDLPAEVVAHARLAILDTLGVMVAAQDYPVGRIISAHVGAFGGRRDARVIGTALRVSAPMAALANGTLAHGLDFDDHKHLSTHTLPAALALAELRGATTAKLLQAYVIGREVGAKLGAVVEPARKSKRGPTYRGWYRVGVVGPIAAAISAGVVLGLTVEQTRHAIGIAASSASGLRRNQGTMTKALQAGNAARDGVHAALLAARGFTADVDILEAKLGLVNAICLRGETDWSALSHLGAPYDLAGTLSIKRFPACSPSHKPVAAMLRLRAANEFDVDDIVSIEADLHTFSLFRTDPREAIATGYSLPYLLCVALLDGLVGLEQAGESRMEDSAVRRLMAKVRHDPDAAVAGYPERVTVQLKDGRMLTAQQDGKPDLQDQDEVVQKFRTCARRLLDDNQSDRLTDAVMRMPGNEPVSDVLELTAPGAFRDGIARPTGGIEEVTEACW